MYDLDKKVIILFSYICQAHEKSMHLQPVKNNRNFTLEMLVLRGLVFY